MKIKIRDLRDERVILSGEYASIKEAIEKNKNTDFSYAGFQNNGLVGADFEGVNFEGADFEGVDFSYADLRDTNLKNVNLGSANLRHANLKNANLKNADLEGADLYGADLRNANLENINLKNTNFVDANFENADLSDAIFKNIKNYTGELIMSDKNSTPVFPGLTIKDYYLIEIFKHTWERGIRTEIIMDKVHEYTNNLLELRNKIND